MRAVHNTRLIGYRYPFGAVPVGGTVVLNIDIEDAEVSRVLLRLWSDTRGERFQEMQPDRTLFATAEERDGSGSTSWSAVVSCDEPEILWYRFVIELADGSRHSYGAAEGSTGGEGVIWWEGDPPSFQITVYEPRETPPTWYTDGIVYQIFPDRFARGADWRERVEASLSVPRSGPDRMLVEDWSVCPGYRRDARGRIRGWEFSGGTLSGIREKLDYLSELGVSVIYLNPVFEAASPHRYDTADFFRIDPMLGTEQDFSDLCADAAAHGIRIILDGVFNHVGRDSRYFNIFGNYAELGAAQSADSIYHDWFSFREDGSWDSWWGVDDLPSIDGNAESYRELICGEDGVVRHWLRAGASGWRLDVADELPESLIQGIRDAALAEKEDALILGEVWEDASNKISYGELRHYLLGRELDGVMDYPFREGVVEFLLGRRDASELAEALETLHENYPPEALDCCLNLIGSHDRARILTLLGGAPAEEGLSYEQKRTFRLGKDARSLAKGRLWLATLLQMAMPGVPSLYYGDEAGVEGYSDPFNRATHPWEDSDADCATIWRNAMNLRRTLPLMHAGSVRFLAPAPDVFGIRRDAPSGSESLLVLVNRNRAHGVEVELEAPHTVAEELMEGIDVDVVDGRLRTRLAPLGSAVIRLREPGPGFAEPLERGVGVLCHVSSLPTDDGLPGTLGAPAERFIDWLADLGQRYWQVLPVNPTDAHNSPYAGLSAFAGNTALMERGTDVPASVEELPAHEQEAYRAFCAKNAHWLDVHACYRACKERFDEAPWRAWPAPYRDWSPALVDDPTLREAADRVRLMQFRFQQQWDRTRAYADAHGIAIVGDMPIYVSPDSADVWANRDLFELDADGAAPNVSGAPPDAFSEEGQVWGNPLYRWDRMREDGFSWWLDRLGRAFGLYDYVRLDHFLGFSAYYCVPAGRKGTEGFWRLGPGMDLFEAAHERFGALPIIAEDLGRITPAARALMARCGFPGMDILQFSEQDVRSAYVPPRGKLVYPGTHDNQTLLGWVETRFGTDGAPALARRLLERCLASRADVVIVALQDILGKDDSCRMNTPGTVAGNWSWQASWSDLVTGRGTYPELLAVQDR